MSDVVPSKPGGDYNSRDEFEQLRENFCRSAVGRGLFTLAEREGYDCEGSDGNGWLLWGDATSTTPKAFEYLFPMPEFFEAKSSFPRMPWLASRLRSAGDWTVPQERHRQLKEELSDPDTHRVPVDKVPLLITWRDGVEKQLERIFERLQENLTDIRSVLKVWYVQAKRPLLPAEGPPFSEEDPRWHTFDELAVYTGRLWKGISGGVETSTIDGWLPFTLQLGGASEELVEAQKRGIMHYLSERDELLEEALPLHAQRWGLEVLLQRALVCAPVMSEEEVNARSRQEPSRLAHERTVHMGKKVNEYRKKHGHDYGKTGSGEETPIFTADGIKDWLREDMINPNKGEPYSRATVLNAAQETGCWVNTKQGRTKGLKESLDNLENYYLKHRQKSKK